MALLALLTRVHLAALFDITPARGLGAKVAAAFLGAHIKYAPTTALPQDNLHCVTFKVYQYFLAIASHKAIVYMRDFVSLKTVIESHNLAIYHGATARHPVAIIYIQ